MSSDNPKNPSWKQTAGTGRPDVRASRKPWQPARPSGAGKPPNPRARYRKRAAAAGFFGALLIAMMAIVFNFVHCYKAPALVLVAPDTNLSLSSAANVYGANSMQALSDWAGKDKNRPRVVTDAAAARSRDGWKTALDKTPEQTILLYFAAHGATDRNGPYLWLPPADAAGIDESHKLPVKDILSRLADQAIADKQKLVIFDATQTSASWVHGYLHNDFARGLKALDAEIARIPNLVIICSTDEDQRSWIIEEHRRSAFGFFLEAGLRNNLGGKHPRVNAGVLFDYLHKEIQDWARSNRDVEQTPLLLPVADGRRRAEKIEIVSNPSDRSEQPASTPDTNFAVPGDLRLAWETAEGLAKREPPPETAAPFVWRTYLDTLMRWELLVRAAAPTEAIQRRAEALERALRQELFESDPPCLANSLAVPLAFGLTIEPISAASFNRIWRPLASEKPESVWKEMLNAAQAKGGDRAGTLLRLAATRKVFELIDQTSDEPLPAMLKRAAETLAIIEENQPRPIESHFVQVLQRDGDVNLPRDLALRAIRLRMETDRVALLAGTPGTGYAYAEQVHRWVRASIRAADRERRRGEDLLFAGDAVSWNRCADHLARAEALYQEAAGIARVAGEALRIRDRSFARVPYYARWIASYRGTLPMGEIERVLNLVEKIAGDTHQLAEMLEEVPDQPVKELADLKNLTGVVQASLRELETVFDSESTKLTSNVLPSNWHTLDNVLTVPFLPVERRCKLLLDLRVVSRELLQKGQSQAGNPTATVADAKSLAQRQGRMALAILGARWIEDSEARQIAPRGALALHFGDLRQRITQPNAGAWWESLREAGEQIGWHWRMMAPRIHAALDEAAQAELKAAVKNLAVASHLDRLIDSATPVGPDRSPAAEDRRYWTHELLLWQARRTAEDGWAKLDRGAPVREYCEEAGERYAFAAEKLILGPNPNFETRERKRRLTAVTLTRGLLKAPEFELDWAQRRDLTDSRPWNINYRVAPAPGLLVGYPILRRRPTTGPIQVADPNQPERLPLLDFAAEKPLSATERAIVYTFGKLDENTATGRVQVDLLYRGRLFEMKTPVSLMSKPDIEWVYTPPRGTARFTILGSKDLQQGSICLLIDISDSMREQLAMKDERGRNPRKIEAAIEAILEVLDHLPDGVMLSIALFHGDRERKREQIDWLTDKPMRWGQIAIQKEAVKNQIRNIKLSPFEKQMTPIAMALEQVVKQGKAFQPGQVGFRSIVVVTDGMDNDERVNDAGELVANLLRSNENDIGLHMILFGLDQKENDFAERQFRPIADAAKFIHLDRTPGTLWPGIQTRKDLVDKLKESMLPKVLILKGVENAERLPKGLPLSLVTDPFFTPSEPLNPGTYQLRALRSRKLLHLEPGDRVLLQMVAEKDRLDLRVPFCTDVLTHIDQLKRSDSKNGLGEPDGRARLTVVKNSLTDRGVSNDLQMVATLEKRTQALDEELRLQRPWFVWFEVTPRDAQVNAKPTWLRVENLHGRVAPAWEVNSGPWMPARGKSNVRSDPALPRVDAWWIDAFPGEHGRKTITRLDRLADEIADFKEISVGGTRIRIDRIAVEEGYLVVEATHEKDQPIVVRVQGLKKDEQRLQLGELHRFYKEPGKYAARFGLISKDDYARQFTLEFYTLESLKKQRDKVIHVRLDTEAPQPDSTARDLLQKVLADN